MNGHLQGFLTFLDLLAEGQRRQAESIAGRRFAYELELQPMTASKVVKIPLTDHQKPRWFAAAQKPRVSVEN